MENGHLSHLALSDDGFLFDSSSGNTFTLNSTGTFILRRLIEGADRKGIMGSMLELYDTSPDVLSKDLPRFFQYLAEFDIVNPLYEEDSHGSQTD